VIAWIGLVMAAELSGTVTDAAGNPLSGVLIYAYDASFRYALAQSRSGGDWSLTGLPPGRYRLRAYPEDDRFPVPNAVERFYPDTWSFCDAEVWVLEEDSREEGISFVLPEGGILTGQVLDPEGNPLPDAWVVCEGESDRALATGGISVTDSNGTFAVVGLDSGAGLPEPYLCQVYAEGYPDQFFGPSYRQDEAELFEVEIGQTTSVGSWTLLPGISVAGTVYGPDGPVNSGAVYVYSSSQVMGVPIAEDGSYLADGLPPGDVAAWAQVEGFGTTYYPDADRPGSRVPVPEEGAEAEGVDLFMPVESALNIQLIGQGSLDEISVLLYNSTYTVGWGDAADAEGKIRLGGLHPGDYTLQVYGADAGFVDGSYTDELGNARVIHVEGETTLELPLRPGAGLSGRVTGEDGTAIYGAQVVVTTTDDMGVDFVTTDLDGSWEVVGLPAGSWKLQVNVNPLCPTDPGWVSQFWEGAYQQDFATAIQLAEGEQKENLNFVLPADDDHDSMGDRWEEENGLDSGRNDAAEDPDDDGFSNLEEWRIGSDPTSDRATGSCGCGDGKSSFLLLLPFVGLLQRRRRATA
jgi:Carboxypeptidase regulatory-like domain